VPLSSELSRLLHDPQNFEHLKKKKKPVEHSSKLESSEIYFT